MKEKKYKGVSKVQKTNLWETSINGNRIRSKNPLLLACIREHNCIKKGAKPERMNFDGSPPMTKEAIKELYKREKIQELKEIYKKIGLE